MSNKQNAGKGCASRPTDREKFSSGWDLAFGKKCKHDFVWGGKRMPCYQCRHCGAIEKGEPDGDVKHRPGG